MQKKKNYSSPYELEGRIPLGQAILYGLQHVMAMFVGNLTPVLLYYRGMCLRWRASASDYPECYANGRNHYTAAAFYHWAGGSTASYCNGDKFWIYWCM